mgnify:CR=1 FL=1
MAEILGLGVSHGPIILTPPEVWHQGRERIYNRVPNYEKPAQLLEELGLLEAPETKAEPEPEDAPIFSVDSEDIWRVPNAGSQEPSVLRFAEDIMPERARPSDGRTNKRGNKSRGGKGRKAGSAS